MMIIWTIYLFKKAKVDFPSMYGSEHFYTNALQASIKIVVFLVISWCQMNNMKKKKAKSFLNSDSEISISVTNLKT